MRRYRNLLTAFVVLLIGGCQKTGLPHFGDVRSNLQDAGRGKPRQRQSPSNRDRQTDNATHVVVSETSYYTSGPQQGRPADGKFPVKTRVKLLKQAGSYALVRSTDGVQAFVATSALQPIGIQMTPELKTLVNGNNQFACDLYGRLRTESGNLFFSPGSISTALAMTYAGAKGNTAAQMAAALHFKLPQDQLHPAFAALSERVSAKKEGMEVRIANRLWGQAGYPFLPEYLQLTKHDYGAELGQVDFVSRTEAARQTINTWVEQQTDEKIKDLIPQGALDEMTRLVLTNAIYFKGDWASPFDKKATKKAPFYLSADRSVEVPMMFENGLFRFAAVDGDRILALPYAGDDLSMWVLLPKEIDGLAALEAKLTPETLQKWETALRRRSVDVYLPRFKAESSFSLSGVLQAMGMTTAFAPGQADFSGMTERKDLSISEVVHKAFVDVNEKGTEAAAATGVVIGITSVQATPEFRADHPFVFLIRDNHTGSILFMGRMENPGD